MTRRLSACVVVVTGLVSGLRAAGAAPIDLGNGYQAEEIVGGLAFPTRLSVAEDGTMLVAEKTGRVRLVRDGTLLPNPVLEVGTRAPNEAGLTGIAMAPDFAATGAFLIAYTPSADASHWRVSRYELNGDTATVVADPWIEYPSRSNADRHFGTGLAFDGGFLYVTMGDLREAEKAQDPALPHGKLLRYLENLEIPDDNPTPGSPVIASGLRSPFGLYVKDGHILVTDNSDDTCDELNEIEPGTNHGWPEVQGYCDHFPEREACGEPSSYQDPAFEFRRVIAPTGVLRYEGDLMPELSGDILVGGYHSKRVHRLRRTSPAGPLREAEPLFRFDDAASGYFGGGVVDLRQAPDGALLVMIAGTSAGSIVRITPRASDPAPPPGPAPPDAPSACSSTMVPHAGSFTAVALAAACAGGAALRRRRPRRAR